MSLFSVSLNFFSRVELFSASCVHCSCNSSTVISLKWVLVSFFYLLNSPKICCQNMRKLRCKITYKKSNINFWKRAMQKSDLPSFFYSLRSYRLLYNTFFCTRATTYFLGSNFLCFSSDCSTQHKGCLECLLAGFFECFSRRGDEQRFSSLWIYRRCPRHVGFPSGAFAALAKPGDRGLQRHNKCVWYS